jgi:hypothetical protein
MTPYAPLEVVETKSRIAGRQFWVRDDDGSWFWCVEYIDRRLACFCDDGKAHAESPDVEPECKHLRAVIDAGMAERRSSSPAAPINVAAWVE